MRTARPRPQASPKADPILFTIEAMALGWSDPEIAAKVKRDVRTLRRWRAQARAAVQQVA